MTIPDLNKLIPNMRVPKSATWWGRRLAMGAITGFIVGIATAIFELAIETGSEYCIGKYTVFGSATVLHFRWAFLFFPTLGGLIAGLIAYRFYHGKPGHGVDIMVRAFHRNRGEMDLLGPSTKAAGCAVVISSGGSVGPEGPIAALGAALGSLIGRIFPTNAHERRILLIAGCAAGIGAIFRSPLGGALFATSVLYAEPEFESDSIVPSFVASVIGYTTFTMLQGYHGPMLEGVESLHFTSPIHLVWYAVLGPLCGLIAIFFYFAIRFTEHRIVPRIHLPLWMLPAIGGLVTGLIGCLLPQVMDGRFSFMQNALDGSLFNPDPSTLSPAFASWTQWAILFALIAIAKTVATGVIIGSGAPGGVLGPSVFIGGALGAFLGAFGEALFPGTFPDELRQALIPVGMAGVLAATMRTPLAAIVMTTEMTGSFGLIAPLMLVCVTAYVIGKRWGLNHEQVRTATDSPTHAADPVIHLLESWRVADLTIRDWPMTVTPDTGLDEIIASIQPGQRPVIAVAERDHLLGVISASDIGEVMSENTAASLLIASEIMTTKLIILCDTDDAYSALNTFNRVDYDTLPVLSKCDRGNVWIGMLTRKTIVEKLQRHLEKSHEAAFAEHPGLRAIRDTLQLDQVAMAVPTTHADLNQLFVPIDAIGKSLRECDFRKKYNAQVVAIQQRDGSVQCPPNLDAPLRTDQRLLAIIWKQPQQKNAPPPQ